MHIGRKSIMKISIFHLTYAHSKKNQAPAFTFMSEGRGPEITKNMVRRLPGLGVPKRPPATSRKWRKGRLKKGLVFKRMKCLGSRLDLLHPKHPKLPKPARVIGREYKFNYKYNYNCKFNS